MKILFATDGSDTSKAALDVLVERPWPPGTQVRVVAVADAFPFIPDPAFLGYAAHLESEKYQHEWARDVLSKTVEELAAKAPTLEVESEMLEGNPKREITKTARDWGADLILMGAHGHGGSHGLTIGSVAHATLLHAPCSVQIVRSPPPEAPH